MDQLILGFFGLVIPLIAIAVAIAARQRSQVLESRLDALEERLKALQPSQQTVIQPRTVLPPALATLKPDVTQEPDSLIRSAAPIPSEQSSVERFMESMNRTPEASQARPPMRVGPPDVPVAPTPPRPQDKATSLEETLGTRLTVWIGAIALALAAAYLVKYTFDRNLLTPRLRIVIGLLFGSSLLGVGEYLRTSSRRVAEGVTAAGVADLFTCLLAATNLYHLVSPITGFIGMAIVTALAVLLSLRHGPFVAGLGLIGGFLTPALIHTGETSPTLFIYLFFLEVGLLVVARRRGWIHLAVMTMLGAMGWAAFWMAFLFQPEHGHWIGGFLLVSMAAFVIGTRWRSVEKSWGTSDYALSLAWASLGIGLLLMGQLVHVSQFSTVEWGFAGLLGIGCLTLARVDQKLHNLAWLAAAVTFFLLADQARALTSDAESSFKLTMWIFGLLYAGSAYAAMWRSRDNSSWAGLSLAVGLCWFVLAYFALHRNGSLYLWSALSMTLAALYAIAAVPMQRSRRFSETYSEALNIFVLGVAVFVTIAVPMVMKREWMGIAWAMEIPILAIVERRLHIETPRRLIWPLIFLVAARLFLNPAIVHYPISGYVVFNWYTYGYGLPLTAFWIAAWYLRRIADDRVVLTLEHGALIMGAVLLTLQIRQLFHPHELDSPVVTLAEWGVISIVWLGYGWLLLRGHRVWPRISLRNIGWGMTGLACIEIVFGQLLPANPLWTHDAVGTIPIFNTLLIAYGAPAVMLVSYALYCRNLKTQEAQAASLFGVLALVLFFTLISLEIRQYYHGEFLDGGVTSSAERYAYSVGWVLYGTLLLVLGILTRGSVLRYASLVIMLLSAGKVFLFDTAHLRDLYRVFSFLGLGISLLLLGYLYQRFVFNNHREKPPATPLFPPEPGT